jgi:trigger factor
LDLTATLAFFAISDTAVSSVLQKLRDKSLAGKKAVFDVEVLQAAKRVVPELTDEFAAQVKAGLTKDTLLKELRKAIDEEDAKEFLPARNKALGEALAKIVEVDVPDTLVTNQAREKFAVMMADMRDNGVADAEIKRQINPENFAKYKEIVKDDIIRDFKVSMATDEIGRLEGITVPDYQVEEQMQSIQKDMQKGEEYDENMIRARVQATLERQAVMNWLAEKADLEVIEKTEEQFDADLMEKLAQESLEREQKLAAKKEDESATQAPQTEKKFEDMTLEEKAFQALVDAGAVKPNDDPNSPDYDHSTDNEIAS